MSDELIRQIAEDSRETRKDVKTILSTQGEHATDIALLKKSDKSRTFWTRAALGAAISAFVAAASGWIVNGGHGR